MTLTGPGDPPVSSHLACSGRGGGRAADSGRHRTPRTEDRSGDAVSQPLDQRCDYPNYTITALQARRAPRHRRAAPARQRAAPAATRQRVRRNRRVSAGPVAPCTGEYSDQDEHEQRRRWLALAAHPLGRALALAR